METSRPSLYSKLNIFAFLIVSCLVSLQACTPGMISRSTKQLDDNISLFNLKFEGRAGHHALFLVDPDYREKFMSKIHTFNERIRFMDSSLISMEFLHNDEKIDPNNIEAEDLKTALATFSYQVTRSPSVTLETLLVKQKWVLKNDSWYVQPDLDVFLARKNYKDN